MKTGNVKTHKVVGLYSDDTYLTGTLNECEDYVAYELAGSFRIAPLNEVAGKIQIGLVVGSGMATTMKTVMERKRSVV